MTNWYCLPYKDILDLIQIIVRSSMVIKITAGKLIHMSIFTFGDVSYLFVHIRVYSPITAKSDTVPGNENRFRLFESVAANDVTNYTPDLLTNKVVKFKI